MDGQAGTREPTRFLQKLQVGSGICVNGRWDLGERKEGQKVTPRRPSERGACWPLGSRAARVLGDSAPSTEGACSWTDEQDSGPS